MANSQTTIIPHTQQPLVTRDYPSREQLDDIIVASATAQEHWKVLAFKDRLEICRRFLDEMKSSADIIAGELTMQMGRPISQTPGELKGFLARGDYLLSIAEDALRDVPLPNEDPNFRRFIRRVPYGVAFLIVPWNYPFLTTVNSLLPALLAGNTVLLKPSPQTPLTAERIASAFLTAGLPRDVLQVVHLPPQLVKYVCGHPKVTYISFTGSVSGGRDVDQAAAASGDFKVVGLELGGKDPAYVRADVNIDYAVGELVDGALFNSGQSCCAIERIYVHESIYEDFTRKFVDLVKTYKLGDPTQSGTNLGPVVSGDEEAVQLMNDSKYGLTASVWTKDQEAFEALVDKIDAGTVFQNRCDYLDPGLAWTGVKHSGRGVSLSKYGFDQVTRAKSVHIKIVA
ncbi:hypothetical protein FRC20_005210 [Serendipita sp. 405]|nr:hypothetical protein FRC20_005210 [Serendipita sp. 405]